MKVMRRNEKISSFFGKRWGGFKGNSDMKKIFLIFYFVALLSAFRCLRP